MWVRAVAALVLLLAAIVGAQAPQQQPPAPSAPAGQQAPAQQPPAQQPPTFRTSAELVRVDATVLDGKGQPVTTLTADDFLLEEDGVIQRIQSFKLIELSGEPAPGSDVSLKIGSIAHGATEAARDDVRVFVVFWDEYHIPPQFAEKRLRDDLIKFVRSMIGPTDLVAIMDQWTPMSHLRFTRDESYLMDAVMSLRGRQGVFVPARNGAEENHLRDYRRINGLRAQVALSALRSTMLHLGALREGRKAILYVGREFGGRYATQEATDLIRTANDANVAFYSINPDGVEMGIRAGILSDIARNTGGESLMTNSPEVAFQRIVRQASAVYLLGYSPEPLRHDGKFHKIKVGVKRAGLQVRSRNGYWAPTPGAKAEASARAVSGVLAPEVAATFGQLARLGRDPEEGVVALRTILVPDPPNARLSMAAPSLWRVRRPADLRIVMSEVPPPPEMSREFERTDRLIVRFAPAGTDAERAALSAELIDRRGRPLTTLPIQRQGQSWMLDLPLSSIARGDYALLFAAKADESRAAAYVPLRVR